MRIGELAIRLGVSRDTIRGLEGRGIITPQRDWNGHRRFSEKDVEMLRTLLFGTKLSTEFNEEKSKPLKAC